KEQKLKRITIDQDIFPSVPNGTFGRLIPPFRQTAVSSIPFSLSPFDKLFHWLPIDFIPQFRELIRGKGVNHFYLPSSPGVRKDKRQDRVKVVFLPNVTSPRLHYHPVGNNQQIFTVEISV